MMSPAEKWIEPEVITLSETSTSRKIKITFLYAELTSLFPPSSPYPPRQAFTHVKLEEGLFVGERGTREGNGEQI